MLLVSCFVVLIAWRCYLENKDSVWCKELGRRTGMRSPMEQTPQPKLVQGRDGGRRKSYFVVTACYVVLH